MNTDLNTDLQIQDLETDYSNEKIPEDSIKKNPLDPYEELITQSKNPTIAWSKIQIIFYSFLMFLVVTTVIASVFFSVKKLSQKHTQSNLQTSASQSDNDPDRTVFSTEKFSFELIIPDEWVYLEEKDSAFIFSHTSDAKKMHIIPVTIDEYLLKPQLEKATGIIAEYCTRQSSLLRNISCTAKIISLENRSSTQLPMYHADLEINNSESLLPVRIVKHKKETHDTIILMSTDSISPEDVDTFAQSIQDIK